MRRCDASSNFSRQQPSSASLGKLPASRKETEIVVHGEIFFRGVGLPLRAPGEAWDLLLERQKKIDVLTLTHALPDEWNKLALYFREFTERYKFSIDQAWETECREMERKAWVMCKKLSASLGYKKKMVYATRGLFLLDSTIDNFLDYVASLCDFKASSEIQTDANGTIMFLRWMSWAINDLVGKFGQTTSPFSSPEQRKRALHLMCAAMFHRKKIFQLVKKIHEVAKNNFNLSNQLASGVYILANNSNADSGWLEQISWNTLFQVSGLRCHYRHNPYDAKDAFFGKKAPATATQAPPAAGKSPATHMRRGNHP